VKKKDKTIQKKNLYSQLNAQPTTPHQPKITTLIDRSPTTQANVLKFGTKAPLEQQALILRYYS